MSTLKERLETHPIKNLNAVIKSVKSEIAPKLALSKDKKRHSKAKLIEHILLLDKMGLLKQDVPVYKSPAPKAKKSEAKIVVDLEKVKKSSVVKVDVKKAKSAGVKIINKKPKAKAKAQPKPASAQEIKDSLMISGNYTLAEIKAGKGLVKNQPKKSVSITKKEAQALADSLDKPSKKSLIDELKDLPDFKNPTNVPKKAKAPAPKKAKSPVDTIVDLKQAMSPIFDKKFNPKSVVDRIDTKKDIDDINKEITIIQKKVKEVSSKSKSSGKETEAQKRQLQKLQEKYTKRLKSIVNSIKKGASFL
tara:strand:+ start:11968 stop:12882 length:915 start_codon:yes stop_codon:yes gene_type:complete